jgi:anaerobic magnesium-protoporphyrin IX monomethyl ester cyclase
VAKVVFVQDFWFEYLGPIYLTEVLEQAGHTVEAIVEPSLRKLIRKLSSRRPDVVAFYCTTGTHQWVLSAAQLAKQQHRGAVTAVGGPHPTFFPEMVESDGIDVICRGEGEGAMLDLVECVASGGDYERIPNLWVKSRNGEIIRNEVRDLIADLDSLPFNRRRLYRHYWLLRTSPSKHFVTARGCPYQCSFCFNHRNMELYRGKGTYLRRHSPERVVEEIRYVRRQYGLTSVRFDDDLFILDPPWLFEFLEMYAREIGLPYFCTVRANSMTEEIAEALGSTGCHSAYFGIESGNDFLRNDVLRKGITPAQIERAADLLKRRGVKVGTFNMLGLPGETVDQAFETVHLNQRIRPHFVWASLVQPYPRTALAEYCVREGYLGEDAGLGSIYSSYFKQGVLRNPVARQLENLQKLFAVAVRHPRLEAVLRRLIRRRGGALFQAVFYLSYLARYVRTYRVPLWRMLIVGLRSTTHRTAHGHGSSGQV